MMVVNTPTDRSVTGSVTGRGSGFGLLLSWFATRSFQGHHKKERTKSPGEWIALWLQLSSFSPTFKLHLLTANTTPDSYHVLYTGHRLLERSGVRFSVYWDYVREVFMHKYSKRKLFERFFPNPLFISEHQTIFQTLKVSEQRFLLLSLDRMGKFWYFEQSFHDYSLIVSK